jgi:hypothetical protein
MQESLYYVNEALMVGFPILGASDHDQTRSEPDRLLHQAESERVIAVDPRPFVWASGLVSNDMSLGEFRETIEAAAKEADMELPG